MDVGYCQHEPVSRVAVSSLLQRNLPQWQFTDAWHYPPPSDAVIAQFPSVAKAWNDHGSTVSRSMCAVTRPVYIGRLQSLSQPVRPAYGLFAGCFIAAGSDIGHYCGKLMTCADVAHEGALREHGRYALDLDLADENPLYSLGGSPDVLVVDASLHRNEMAFINDFRQKPITRSDSSGGGGDSSVQCGLERTPNVDTPTGVCKINRSVLFFWSILRYISLPS